MVNVKTIVRKDILHMLESARDVLLGVQEIAHSKITKLYVRMLQYQFEVL